MCVDWGVTTSGAKSVLIDRLVEAHRRGRVASPEAEVKVAVAERPAADGSEAPSTAPVAASNVRFVPPPPSSWGMAPKQPPSWSPIQDPAPAVEAAASSSNIAKAKATESAAPAQASDVSQPRQSTESAKTNLASKLETAVGTSPTPARLSLGVSLPDADKAALDAPSEVGEPPREGPKAADAPTVDASGAAATTSQEGSGEASRMSAACSNDWWRNVASRWPSIVANLKAGAGGQKDEVGVGCPKEVAPSSPRLAAAKRAPGSPSILEGFQSPKRRCTTASGGSPMAAIARQTP